MSGITTALDSVRIWREAGAQEIDGQDELLAEAIAKARDADIDGFLTKPIRQSALYDALVTVMGVPDGPGARPVVTAQTSTHVRATSPERRSASRKRSSRCRSSPAR